MPLDGGKKTVAVAGTPEALAGSTRTSSITVTALSTNTKPIWVGGVGTTSAGAKKGTPLNAGDSISYTAELDDVDDLAQVIVDVEVNGEGVSYSYGHKP